MSLPAPPPPATLVISLLGSRWELFWPDLMDTLCACFGPVFLASLPIPFSFTSYYDAELGTPITRRLLGFADPVPQDTLADIKLATNAMENALMDEKSRRLVNIDPGLVTAERLVLATGKNFTHRVYLRDGIFADLTLIHQKGDWKALPWSFPDYQSEPVRQVLGLIRSWHLERLKRERRGRKPF